MPGGSAGMGTAEAFAAPESLMGEDRLHVVFGTGQVGQRSLPCSRDEA